MIYEIIDFIIGKIGWLGVFTSPEDLAVAMERAPKWFAAFIDLLSPYYFLTLNLLLTVLSFLVSYQGLSIVFALVLLLLAVDVDYWKQLLSFLKFRVRSKMSEKVWIDEDDAISLMQRSDWGKIIAPNVVESKSILDGLSGMYNLRTETTVHGMSEKQRKLFKFHGFLKKTLDAFAEMNPTVTRTSDGDRQFDEAGLRQFLDKLFEIEIKNEFGPVPRIRLD